MANLITLVDGVVPVAADFNSNFVALNTEVRPYNTGGTGQSSWSKGDLLYASAANALSKLPIGVAGNVLSVSSTGVPTWAGGALLKTGTDITVSDSTTETSLLGPLSIAANTLGTANRLRILLLITVSNSSGAARNYTVRLKYGGTTLASKVQSVNNSVSNALFAVEATVAGDDATNAQIGELLLAYNTTGYDRQLGSAAVDSTTAQNLDVTLEMATSSVNETFTMKYALVTLES